MMEFIMTYWPAIPAMITAASVIAKITPNETDNKIVAILQKIIDTIALSSTPTTHKVSSDKTNL